VLRSDSKRAREEVLSEGGAETKSVKAMLAMIDWFSDDISNPIEEAAMMASVAKHNICILTTYKEAVNDPDYRKQ
jgi:hypothetical protein